MLTAKELEATTKFLFGKIFLVQFFDRMGEESITDKIIFIRLISTDENDRQSPDSSILIGRLGSFSSFIYKFIVCLAPSA